MLKKMRKVQQKYRKKITSVENMKQKRMQKNII
jgi:hypothetical protein